MKRNKMKIFDVRGCDIYMHIFVCNLIYIYINDFLKKMSTAYLITSYEIRLFII